MCCDYETSAMTDQSAEDVIRKYGLAFALKYGLVRKIEKEQDSADTTTLSELQNGHSNCDPGYF